MLLLVMAAIILREPFPPIKDWLWGGVAGLGGGFVDDQHHVPANHVAADFFGRSFGGAQVRRDIFPNEAIAARDTADKSRAAGFG